MSHVILHKTSDEVTKDSIGTRLAVYGTLAPGKSNHEQLSSLKGTWTPGTVLGRLLQEGWAVDHGYLALQLDPKGSPIDVQIFESLELPSHLNRLDEFEGQEYKRVVADVHTDRGHVSAWIYVCSTSDSI